MAASLSKKKKALIIAAAVLLVLAIVGIIVMFTVCNNIRYSAYTKGRMKKEIVSYLDKEVKFIAHRGLSNEAYQNTEEAFLLAAQDDNVWGIETDVWATCDGGIVCMHDKDSLFGISDVKDVTLEVATTTPIADDRQKYAPTLQKYLEICAEHGKVAVVEIKDKNMGGDVIDTLIEAVRDSGAQARYISFHMNILEQIRERDGNAQLQYLSSGVAVSRKTIDRAIELRCDFSCYHVTLAKRYAKRFRAAGLKIGVWTINDPKLAVCYVSDYSVDYITTDIRMKDAIDDYILQTVKDIASIS